MIFWRIWNTQFSALEARTMNTFVQKENTLIIISQHWGESGKNYWTRLMRLGEGNDAVNIDADYAKWK